MNEVGFRRRTALVAGAVAVGSFLFALLAGVFAPEDVDLASSQADAYSRSAIGHRALVEMLRELRVPVTVSRWDSGRRAGDSAALLLIEPRLGGGGEGALARARLERALGAARHVLLVLPKWRGEPDPDLPAHLRSVRLVSEANVRRVLAAAGADVPFVRSSSDGALRCDGGRAPELTAPQLLAADPAVRPLVACDGGVLLGEVPRAGGGRLLLLSDPDVLSNHGLGRGSNALVAWDAIERVRAGGRPALVDVSLLGFEKPPALGRDLFIFPLSPALVQALVALAAWLWAAGVRVGRPLPLVPVLAPGKDLLIDTSVALLRRGGHAGYLLRRYRDETFREVGRARHAPPAADGPELVDWLERLRSARSDDPRALYERVEHLAALDAATARALAVARRLHRYREELTRGAE